MKAVIYARYSSDNQREESITAQVRACTEYAERQGYSVVRAYTDEARSATTDDRPSFLQMIHDISSGLLDIDVVLVHKLDRFARNRYDSAFYRREQRKRNVRLESVLEPLDDSPESVILESVLEGMAEYYSRNLAREARKGMKENAYECKHNGGLPPLGYDVDPETKKYVINEKEAEAVRLIFARVLEGVSYTALANELNSKGYRTKIGQPFNKNSFTEILANEKYKGVYVWDRAKAKTEGKRNNHESKPEEEIIKIPGGVPAIVDEEVFDAVQHMRAQRRFKGAANKAKLDYLLSGKIVCGMCESPYVGDPGTRGRKYRQPTYKCSKRKRDKGCTNKSIGKETVEGYVVREVMDRLFSEKGMAILAEKVEAHYKKTLGTTTNEIFAINKQIAETQKKIGNLIDAIESGAVDLSLVGARLREHRNNLDRLETLKRDIEKRLSLRSFDKQLIIDYLKTEREKALTPEGGKALIKRYVDKVIIYPDNVQVILKLDLDGDMTGGGGGSRTPVRKKDQPSLSERSLCFAFRPQAAHRQATLRLSLCVSPEGPQGERLPEYPY